MMRIYVTHCSAKKDDSLKGTGKRVTPDKLYTSTPIRRFMEKCKEKRVKWAIFSDLHGIWFPNVEHEWYDKDSSKVTDAELAQLVEDFILPKLRNRNNYTKIMAFVNEVQKVLLDKTRLRGCTNLFVPHSSQLTSLLDQSDRFEEPTPSLRIGPSPFLSRAKGQEG
jgi:hypothetical protein